MLEDPVLTEYRVNPITPDKIVHIEDSEVAYVLESVSHGTCETTKECQEKLEKPGRRDPRGRGRLTTGAEIRQTPNKQNKNDPCRNSCRQGIFM